MGEPIYTGGFNGDYIIRNEEGKYISQFYGYVTDGLFQNETEVRSYTNEHGDALQPNARPGDIRYLDLNNDGKINEKDKTYIGNPFPDLMIGLNLNASCAISIFSPISMERWAMISSTTTAHAIRAWADKIFMPAPITKHGMEKVPVTTFRAYRSTMPT